MFEFEPHPKPLYRLSVDGQDLSAVLDGRLVGIRHTDYRGFQADTLEVEIDDTRGLLDLPPRGAHLRLALGWDAGGLIDKGSYVVDCVRHTGAPDRLTITANSADLRTGLTTQRERSWHQVTLGDVVRTIADENGLVPMIPAALAGEAIDHLDQTHESAVNLLTRLAKQFDAIATVKDGRLLFIPAGGAVSASGKPLPPVVIQRESGDHHVFEIADREGYTAVRATYYDQGRGERGEVVWTGTEDLAERRKVAAAPVPAPTTGQYKDAGKIFKTRERAQREAKKQWQALKKNRAARAAWIGVKAKYDDRNLGVSGEVTWGQADDERAARNAAKLAQKDADKLAAREAPSEPSSALEHSAENIKTLRHVYSSKANALRAARAEWRRLQRGLAYFSITLCRGRPELFPEIPATVSGFKPAIDSTDWVITRVTNTVNDDGYTTAIDLEIRATEIPG